jgi:DNA-binding transcriptional MerR regulator
MMLKIGELARRTGLTVRALHHYDSIGLLQPSARSDAGYRLYDRNDVARLHEIQALRRFGMALADIGIFLASPGAHLADIVDQQIAALTRQIEQSAQLRTQLTRLRGQLGSGAEPDLAEWLTTLELMTMYDKYFTQDELAQLPFAASHPSSVREWEQMVAQARRMMDEGIPPSSQEAQQLGRQWMIALERDTGGNVDFALRMTAMQDNEPALVAQNGLTREIKQYVLEGFTHFRLGLMQKYVTAGEFAFIEANYRKRGHEWPGLIARVRKVFDAGLPPGHPDMCVLAHEWMDLTCSYAGSDPATHARLRSAYEKEPMLMIGSWITDDMRAYIGAAMAAARPSYAPG